MGSSKQIGKAMWRKTTIGEFAPFTYGKGLLAKDRNQFGGVPVFGSNGIVGYHDVALTDGPTVVIGRKGSVGKVHYSPVPCWPIDTTFFFSSDDEYLVRFVCYSLRCVGLESMNSDSAVPGLNRSEAQACELSIPPLSEQRRIAGILGALDDKIALNRRMNFTLEGMAQALFQLWFVDYEPVRAKMIGRWRRGESLPGMPAELWDAFPNRLAATELGDAPVGWDARALSECFNLTMGQSPPGRSYNDDGEGMPFFQGRAEFGFRYPQNRRYCTEPKRLAEPDDTLVSVRAPVGTINMAYDRCCIGRGLAALRHKSGSASYTYYAIDALQPAIQQYEQTGTVFGAISKRQFEELPALEPPPEIVSAFDAYARHFDERIRLNTAQSRALTALRDTLLPRLVSGELRV